MVNKRYIILLLGVFVFFIIIAGVLFFQQKPQQSSQEKETTTISGSVHNAVSMPVTLAPAANSPKETTLLFYNYYFSSLTNPLANGAYKNNPYLSDEFKKLIGPFNGNALVFCPQNKSAHITIGQEEQFYYGGQNLTQEVISRTLPSPKDLYRVSLENVGGKWLIYDINCIQ